ncbi:MAG TPA: ATP synthase F1 subunit epsilon [Gemmatimonadales bacterium]|jgi:F-type H+-transporting ATPase subunit epsilon|nr:ATP synthase F1 subunit epsilon [Gemmatimonadales bacterium]
MHVSVISAERSVFDGEAEAVVAPAYDGLVGILPRHAPFITLLGQGIVKIRRSGETTRLRVAGGFLQVAKDVIRIVARSASHQDS